MNFKQEFSSGGCVYKKQPATSNKPPASNYLWLLGKHSGYHKWVLPKGRIEAGETEQETAIRETQEEIGVTAKIIGNDPVHIEKYTYTAELDNVSTDPDKVSDKPIRRVKTYQENIDFSKTLNKVTIDKTVTFYLMEYVSGDPSEHGWEMEDAGWYSYQEALSMLKFDGEKAALTAAYKQLNLE